MARQTVIAGTEPTNFVGSDGWVACSERLPDEGLVVETKMTDPDRNEALLARQGPLWFFADRSMYVYYTPTHWRQATRAQLVEAASCIRRAIAIEARLADEIEGQEFHADRR